MTQPFGLITRGLAILSVALAATAGAAEPTTMPLWPKGAPGAKGEADGDKPSITVYRPASDKDQGTTVVVCPGGGYGFLAMDHEGKQVAEWLNSLGVTAVVLKYRHRASGAGYGHPYPLLDAQRAIRTVRANSGEWKIAADRIGVLGFSAGGHLASTAATHFDKGQADADDPIERAGCRPDFAVLCYPVISLSAGFTHGGSRRNLLGERPDEKLLENLSNEKQVTKETPPTFLWHTSDDAGVPAENSVQFYLALVRAKVPAELHIYAHGKHGLGLGKGTPGVENWPAACAQWMRGRGLLGKQQ